MLKTVVADVLELIDPPNRIRVIPWGTFTANGETATLDAAAARDVAAAMAAQGVDLPIDYEHQTIGGEYASPDGRAPAAGWIKALAIAPGDGLYARVEWTQPAGAAIARREYRYLSPALVFDTADGRLRRLLSVALTNTPAIPGMTPIAASARTTQNTASARPTADPRGDCPSPRAERIAALAREYDANPRTAKLFPSRARFIDGNLLGDRLAPLTPEETRKLDSRDEPTGRAERIAALSRDYDANPMNAKLCASRVSFVNGNLIGDRRAPLTPAEAAQLQ